MLIPSYVASHRPRADLRPEPESVASTRTFPTLAFQGTKTDVGVPPALDPLPGPGERIGDFELLRVLGEGSHGKVYLAQQASLGRRVALKVVADSGHEARAMATLEHESIVRVFSETVEPERGWRLLCMQYVAGPTLATVIERLRSHDCRSRDGRLLLETVDRLRQASAEELDPAAARDRQELTSSDLEDMVSILGSRLADALGYAHARGILHHDVKPANILLDQYGRPLLADFSVASRLDRDGGTHEGLRGTLAYMAPEQLAAIVPGKDNLPVDERSDVYSLGVVLFELLTGSRPFDAHEGETFEEVVASLYAERARGAPSVRERFPEICPCLDRVVRRCLEPDPEDRFQRAEDVARSLDAVRDLRARERTLPAPGLLTRASFARPFLSLALAAVIPQLLGSGISIVYNSLRIVDRLSPEQGAAFRWLVTHYNLAVYPACFVIGGALVLPCWRIWRGFDAWTSGASSKGAELRALFLRLAPCTVKLSCLGWLPGGVIFPLGLLVLAGPVEASVFWHFLLSFLLAGMIAATYAFFAVQFVVLRTFYPRLWPGGCLRGETAARELRDVRRRVRFFRVVAGVIPFIGALLMVGVGPEAFNDGAYRDFRLLVTALIAAGMIGFWVASHLAGRIGRIVDAFAGR